MSSVEFIQLSVETWNLSLEKKSSHLPLLALLSHCFPCHAISFFFSALCAKYVNDKAAKWAKSKRPRKSRPSDINRAPIVYAIHSYQKPAEYDISSEPAAPMAKPAATEN